MRRELSCVVSIQGALPIRDAGINSHGPDLLLECRKIFNGLIAHDKLGQHLGNIGLDITEGRGVFIGLIGSHAASTGDLPGIVLCGKGHETYQIIGTEKTHLDEREEVAAHLREKKGM